MEDTSDSFSDLDSLGCLDQAFSLSDSVYLFEHSVSTIVTADTVAETPSPQVRRRRRHHSRADEDVPAAAVRLPTPVPPRGDGRREKSKRSVCLQVQPPSPHLSPRRSKRRKVNPSLRQKQENSAPAQTAGFVPASSLDDNSFLNVWLDPCQPSTSTSSSSSSSCSISYSLFSTHGSAASASEGEDVSVDNKEVEIDPCGPAGAAAGQSYRDRRSPIDVGSLSFLTTEERAWLGAETTAVEQSAPPPPEEILITSDDEDEAMVRIAQLEEDEVMARRMQEQFDSEQAEPLSSSRSHQHHHHNHMEQFERDQREAQSSRSHQHLHHHDYHGNHHGHMFGMLSSSVWTPPWLDAVQMAGLAPYLYEENDVTARQRRGRGSRRGSRQRRAPPHLFDGSPGNDYEALLEFEERQGTVVAKKTLSKSEINRFPTKKYDSAQTAANTRCQICFCDYTCGEELRMLSCFHDYHMECIDRWLKVNATCPVCRCNMAEGESLGGQA